MYIATLTDIIDLNHILENENISYRVHLRDTCGRQSFYIEILSECYRNDQMAKNIIQHYFETKGVTIKYLNDSLEFIIDDNPVE
jgi:hypothetical protein